ncbi:MAG: hypothetical protein HZR80_09485 [Candidatus Heimdallarchaeota archaeon]
MEKETRVRILKVENENKKLKYSNLILVISAVTIAISFVYLLIRRWILIIDASLEAFGSSGFINRGILLTKKDILAGFTKFFDSLQFVAIVALVIAFILIFVEIKNEYSKILLDILTIFGIIAVLRVIRIVVIHKGPENYELLGTLDSSSMAYYDFAFFIYSTDILRIIITILLIIATVLFTRYLKLTYGDKIRINQSASITLGVFLVIYIVTIFLGFTYSSGSVKVNAAVYYIHYAGQTLLQIGNIIVYSSIAKRVRVFEIRSI